MNIGRFDDPTLVTPLTSPLGGWRRAWGGRCLSCLVPGAWSALAALGLLGLLVLLAPAPDSTARASLLTPDPLILLGAACALGALASLSGIRHLWTRRAPIRGLIGVALGACPLWIASSLLLLRALKLFS